MEIRKKERHKICTKVRQRKNEFLYYMCPEAFMATKFKPSSAFW
jgi:hypothetical protein